MPTSPTFPRGIIDALEQVKDLAGAMALILMDVRERLDTGELDAEVSAMVANRDAANLAARDAGDALTTMRMAAQCVADGVDRRAVELAAVTKHAAASSAPLN